jgi:hypothetical protein
VLTDTDVAHAHPAIEMVALVAAGTGISAMLRTGRLFVEDTITTHALIGYAGAVFNVEPLVTVRTERITVYRTERTDGPNALLAGALIGNAR